MVDIRAFISDCWGDVRYGLRQLRRSPGYAVLTVSALAIGVGANVVIFTFVSSQVLRPIDAEAPSRLVRVSGPGFDTLAPVRSTTKRTSRRPTTSSTVIGTRPSPSWPPATRAVPRPCDGRGRRK